MQIAGRPKTQYRSLLVAGILLVPVVGVCLFYWNKNSEARQDAWLSTRDVSKLQELAKQPEVGTDSEVHVDFALSNKYYSMNRREQAWIYADKAVGKIAQDDISVFAHKVRTWAAILCAEYGDPARAEQILSNAKKTDTSDPELLIAAAELNSRQGNVSEAYDTLILAAVKLPANADVWRRAGKAALASVQIAEAVDCFRNACTLAPNDPALHASLSDALTSFQKFPESFEQATISAKLAPDNPYFRSLPAINRAICARTNQEYLNAVELTKKQLDLPSPGSQLLPMLAGLHLRFDHLEEARFVQERYLTEARADSTGWLELENMCRRLGDARAAETAHSNFQKLIDADDAIHDLSVKTLMHPEDAKGFFSLSIALHRAGRTQQAFEVLQDAARVNPDDQRIAQMLERVQSMLRSSGGGNAGSGRGPSNLSSSSGSQLSGGGGTVTLP